MCGRTYRVRLFVISTGIACLVSFSGMSEANMSCTHDDNKRWVESLSIGLSFESVLTELEAAEAKYAIFSGYQRISIELVRTKGYEEFKPLHVTLISPKLSKRGIVTRRALITEDEILTMSFDAKGTLTGKSCKKIFTGP